MSRVSRRNVSWMVGLIRRADVNTIEALKMSCLFDRRLFDDIKPHQHSANGAARPDDHVLSLPVMPGSRCHRGRCTASVRIRVRAIMPQVAARVCALDDGGTHEANIGPQARSVSLSGASRGDVASNLQMNQWPFVGIIGDLWLRVATLRAFAAATISEQSCCLKTAT
jgi:hypothetical protein